MLNFSALSTQTANSRRRPEGRTGTDAPALEQVISHLESQQVDADIAQNSLRNFVSVLNNLEDQKEQRELLTILLKEVVFDGTKSRVRIDLKPLPKIRGNLDQLEGRFVYCKNWLRD